jgi:putative restriction endonuclease
MSKWRRWTRDELLVVFNLYCKVPFGKTRHGNPRIVEVARLLDRTPSAVSMKMGNLASFDPTLQARGIKGLRKAASADREIFAEFYGNTEALAYESECALERLIEHVSPGVSQARMPEGPTDIEQVVRIRRVQQFFRDMILTNYDGACAISGIALSELLNASHIIPWSNNVERRADPTNGIALSALYDRAFDRGLITFDEDLRVVISDRLLEEPRSEMHNLTLVNISGTKLRLPNRAPPDFHALAYHRSEVFQGNAVS